jgi:hypothetical protein
VSGEGPFRFVFPALVHDGARNTDVKVNGATLTIARLGAPAQAPATERASKPKLGGKLTWQLVTPEGLSLTQLGPQVVTHNGYVQSVVAEVPAGVSEVKWRLTLEPDARKGEAAPKQP